MAQVPYRANLNAATWPFLAEDFGSSVIVPGQDNNFNRQVTAKEDTDKDVGIPQVYYMHNVMPFAQGLQSVGHKLTVWPVATGFTQIFPLRDDSGLGANTYMGIQYDSVTDTNLIWILTAGVWISVGMSVPKGLITVAHLQGKSYIFIAGVGCLRYDFGSSSFVSVTLSGLTTASMLGITYAAGYMIVWDKSSVYWSSTLPIVADTVDFVPSIITGAGSQSLEAARGPITFCFPHQLGFVAYTTQNAVMNVYSNNAMYPFNARELVAAGGLSDPSLIGYDMDTANHYAYTTAGLQLISVNATQIVFPEVTDFISGRRFEDYNAALHEFTYTDLIAPMKKSLNVIASRYLVISYGIDHLTHALIFDLALKRWGKVRINHTAVVEYEVPNTRITDIPKQSIGFLQDSGALLTLDFASATDTPDSCMLLGKYQYVRSRLLQLDEVKVETVRANKGFQLTDLVALDGRDTIPDVGFLAETDPKQRVFFFRAIGTNHTLEFAGTFRVVSLTMKFNVHGKR